MKKIMSLIVCLTILLVSVVAVEAFEEIADGETKIITQDGKNFKVNAVLTEIQKEMDSISTNGGVFKNKKIQFIINDERVEIELNGKILRWVDKISKVESLEIQTLEIVSPMKGRALLKDKTVFEFRELTVQNDKTSNKFKASALIGFETCSSTCRLNDGPLFSCYSEGSRFVDGQTPKTCFKGNIVNQKDKGASCTLDQECIINQCIKGVCGDIREEVQTLEKEVEVQKGLIQRIIAFLKKAFGFK